MQEDTYKFTYNWTVSQVTLYLDKETEALLTEAAAAAGLSRSRWVADLIQRHAGRVWPLECRELAGAYADFPSRSEPPREDSPPDVPRMPF